MLILKYMYKINQMKENLHVFSCVDADLHAFVSVSHNMLSMYIH